MRQLVLEIQRVAVHVWCFEVLRRSPNLDESIVGQAGLGISGEGWIPWIPGVRMDSGVALHPHYLADEVLVVHVESGSIGDGHQTILQAVGFRRHATDTITVNERRI